MELNSLAERPSYLWLEWRDVDRLGGGGRGRSGRRFYLKKKKKKLRKLGVSDRKSHVQFMRKKTGS